MTRKYLFGPVPSRRLGVSLGVDLVPFKTCTLNCVYCECGSTTDLTVTRKEYVPVESVVKELSGYLKGRPELDYITFSGSGEPTLYSRLDEIIDYIKGNFQQYKVAVLTNGTLLVNSEVRAQLRRADVVIPSLDAVSEEVFKTINRPHADLLCENIISGLVKFRREFQGTMLVEVFIVPGVNDGAEELSLLGRTIQRMEPDRVQLNSLDRPGAESWVKALDANKMKEVAACFNCTGIEIIGEFKSRREIASFSPDKEYAIVSTLKRRPCNVQDLSQALFLHTAEVNKYIQTLLEKDQVELERHRRGEFYRYKHSNITNYISKERDR